MAPRGGTPVAGDKIEVILPATTASVPDATKRLAQELVVRDKVSVLAGFGPDPAGHGGRPKSPPRRKSPRC